MRSAISACTEGTAAEAKVVTCSLIWPRAFCRSAISSAWLAGKNRCFGSDTMQLSWLPGVAVTPKATTKTVTPSWLSISGAYLQGRPPQVSSPSVMISRYFCRHSNEVSCAPAILAQPLRVGQVSAEQPLYQVRKACRVAPMGVEPEEMIGRL